MNNEKQRIAIAEACGWKEIADWGAGGINGKHPTEPWVEVIPDYLNDLNAMHEAEKVFDGYGMRQSYRRNLLIACDTNDPNEIIAATAAERAEAFLRTVGKWEEEA